MNKLTAIKIKYDDGTYSDKIPVSVLSENVEWDNTHTLVDVLGSIDVDAKGTIQAQIDKLSNNTQLTDVLGNIDVKADGTVQDQIKKLSNEKVSNTQLTDVLGNVDVRAKGTVQDQIDKLSNNNTQFDTQLASINDDLNDFAINLGNVDVSTKGTLQDQIDKLSAQGAGAHNSIYRGKNLGTSVTSKQWAVINAGTFDDLYIGDYWIIGGVNYRIADFDYFYHAGDTECTTHHVVIVPDTNLDSQKMNDTNVTTGGYTGSKMYTNYMAKAKSKIIAAFSSGHILGHREFLINAVANGIPSGGAWFDSTIEFMSEAMCYGGAFFEPVSGSDYSVACKQLNLFRYRPDMISNRQTFWLRDVISDREFASVGHDGCMAYADASASRGVRPVFCIYQS